MGPTPILEMTRAYGLRPRLWLLSALQTDQDSSIYDAQHNFGVYEVISHFICIFYPFFTTKISPKLMQIFANGKQCFYSFMEFYVIH